MRFPGVLFAIGVAFAADGCTDGSGSGCGGGGGGGGVSVSRKGVLHAAKHVDAFRFKHSFSGMHEHAQA